MHLGHQKLGVLISSLWRLKTHFLSRLPVDANTCGVFAFVALHVWVSGRVVLVHAPVTHVFAVTTNP